MNECLCLREKTQYKGQNLKKKKLIKKVFIIYYV